MPPRDYDFAIGPYSQLERAQYAFNRRHRAVLRPSRVGHRHHRWYFGFWWNRICCGRNRKNLVLHISGNFPRYHDWPPDARRYAGSLTSAKVPSLFQRKEKSGDIAALFFSRPSPELAGRRQYLSLTGSSSECSQSYGHRTGCCRIRGATSVFFV